MFALIYDEFDPKDREKKVISVHPDRQKAEVALQLRQSTLGKRVWDCNTRIVWLYEPALPGETVTPDLFDTWAPQEEIPSSDRVPDGD